MTPTPCPRCMLYFDAEVAEFACPHVVKAPIPADIRPQLELINGGGEIVDMLEDLTARARAGEFDTIAVAIASANGGSLSALAYRETTAPYLRTLGAIGELEHNILMRNLRFEKE